MEIAFEWDMAAQRLRTVPAVPACTNEENARNAALLRDIQGENPTAARVARYKMAEIAYEQKDFYQPVKQLPGGIMPLWMQNPTADVYQGVRDGIKQLQGVAGNAQAYDRLMERSQDAERGAAFLEYVYRVAACESHNEACLRPLLMAIAVMEELNPTGDAGRIKILKLDVRAWYGVDKPRSKPSQRRRQAAHHTKNLRWLPVGWRAVWSSP